MTFTETDHPRARSGEFTAKTPSPSEVVLAIAADRNPGAPTGIVEHAALMLDEHHLLIETYPVDGAEFDTDGGVAVIGPEHDVVPLTKQQADLYAGLIAAWGAGSVTRLEAGSRDGTLVATDLDGATHLVAERAACVGLVAEDITAGERIRFVPRLVLSEETGVGYRVFDTVMLLGDPARSDELLRLVNTTCGAERVAAAVVENDVYLGHWFSPYHRWTQKLDDELVAFQLIGPVYN